MYKGLCNDIVKKEIEAGLLAAKTASNSGKMAMISNSKRVIMLEDFLKFYSTCKIFSWKFLKIVTPGNFRRIIISEYRLGNIFLQKLMYRDFLVKLHEINTSC